MCKLGATNASSTGNLVINITHRYVRVRARAHTQLLTDNGKTRMLIVVGRDINYNDGNTNTNINIIEKPCKVITNLS